GGRGWRGRPRRVVQPIRHGGPDRRRRRVVSHRQRVRAARPGAHRRHPGGHWRARRARGARREPRRGGHRGRGVPSSGVGAVVLNVTGTNPSAATFVAAYPAGGERDGSNLNLLPAQTDSSLVIATVGDGGKVSLYNRFGAVDLIVD